MLKFPYLTAADVEARVGTCTDKGVSLLLYKDSRTDMAVLDETIGAENWQCHYETIKDKLFCTVSIWSEQQQQWVSKQDVGVPSNMESDKGEASDAFKRACFKWGIGRELYTAPFIWVGSDKCTITTGRNGKPTCYDKFEVASMTVEAGRITDLVITLKGKEVFTMKPARKSAEKPAKQQKKAADPTEQKDPMETANLASAKQSAWAAIKQYATTAGVDANEVAADFKGANPNDTMATWQYATWYYTALDAITKWARNHNGNVSKLLDGIRSRSDYQNTAEFWNLMVYEFME